MFNFVHCLTVVFMKSRTPVTEISNLQLRPSANNHIIASYFLFKNKEKSAKKEACSLAEFVLSWKKY